MIIESLKGTKWKFKHFRCICGHDIMQHQGSVGSDGFNSWWNGNCTVCKKDWEVDSNTECEKCYSN